MASHQRHGAIQLNISMIAHKLWTFTFTQLNCDLAITYSSTRHSLFDKTEQTSVDLTKLVTIERNSPTLLAISKLAFILIFQLNESNWVTQMQPVLPD